jgi:hypothetical protein
VIVAPDQLHGHRLRRDLVRTARTIARAVGASLPPQTTIVVQHVAHDGQQHNGVLRAYEPHPGRRHYLIELATTVNGREVTGDELRSTLHQLVIRLLEDVAGQPVAVVPCDLGRLHAASAPPLVLLRPEPAGQDGAARLTERNHARQLSQFPPTGNETA